MAPTPSLHCLYANNLWPNSSIININVPLFNYSMYVHAETKAAALKCSGLHLFC